jgi:hypothetical protein
MTKAYFNLHDDVSVPGRWDLDTPIDEQGRELNDWLFQNGEPVTVEGRLSELARRFAESGEEHLSRLRRKPVV